MSHKLLPDNNHAMLMFILTQHCSSPSQQSLLMHGPTVEPHWVCMRETSAARVHVCVSAPHTCTNCTHTACSFIKFTTCTPLCAAASSHSVMQLIHKLKAHPPTHQTHTHTHADEERERERTPRVHCTFKHALPFSAHRHSCDLALRDHWPVLVDVI